MRFALLPLVLLASPLVAQNSPAPPAEKQLYHFPGLPEPEQSPADPERVRPLGQLFVSPAGEPFRAPPGDPYPVATWFAQVDTNHDGKLDPAEFRADFDHFFTLLDINHDQVIDAAEIKRYETELVPEIHAIDFFGGGRPGGGRPGGGRGPGRGPGRGGHRGGPGGDVGSYGGGHGGGSSFAGDTQGAAQDDGSAGIVPPAPLRLVDPIEGAGRFGLLNIPEPITSMDINLDGRITAAEMTAAARRRFALLDTDNHGYLTQRDLPITEAQRHGVGRKRR
ncbi:EF-hand domain-containing protein [Sphingomonas sp. 28-63-12]|uniref:EF-hand domain-containing protein n=1 Tax=Sphingomonas sp. 28-63-12 TaxID=1970434 RepID=UPI000BD090CC|nr:MAG: hypothetical protein B7Y47_16675 [Sphingomonas sp. 28-63-12]